MGSLTNPQIISSNTEDEVCLQAMRLASMTTLPFALKVAIDLELLEIIAKATTPSRMLSPAEIASQLSTKNPNAPSIIDRILRLLASNSIVTCSLVSDEDGHTHTQRLYGLASLGKYFLQNEDGISFAPELSIYLDKYLIECCQGCRPSLCPSGFLVFPFIWRIPEALITAELSTAFPGNGGFVIWADRAFGPFFGSLMGSWKFLSGVINIAAFPVHTEKSCNF